MTYHCSYCEARAKNIKPLALYFMKAGIACREKDRDKMSPEIKQALINAAVEEVNKDDSLPIYVYEDRARFKVGL